MFGPGGPSSNEPPPPSYEQLFGPGNSDHQGQGSHTMPPYPSSPVHYSPASPPITPANVAIDGDSEIWFAAVDENGDGRISLYELQEALINFDGKPFDIRTCYFLVQMFDDNSDGTIDLREFCALKAYIDKWKAQFDRVDVDRSGNIDQNELTVALTQLGYHLSPQFSLHVIHVFANTQNHRNMNFDAFIRSCAFIHSMSSVFATKRRQQQQHGQPPSDTVTYGFEEFARVVFEFGLTDS